MGKNFPRFSQKLGENGKKISPVSQKVGRKWENFSPVSQKVGRKWEKISLGKNFPIFSQLFHKCEYANIKIL